MVRDRQGIGWFGRLFGLAVILVFFWGIVYPFFLEQKLPPAFVPPIAEDGDAVEVDYRGWFPELGHPYSQRTFDTSIEAVANDNTTYPKAASFSYRSGGARYSPLSFLVACEAGAACPIPAFQDAVKGLRAGETRVVILPPEKAYGPSNPSAIRVRPLLESVTATETMNATEFQTRYGSRAADASIATDRTWGWDVTVRVSGDLVTVRHSPTVHQVLRIAGRWAAEVLSIDDAADGGEGIIQVRHRLIAADVSAFVAADDRGNFIVVAVDSVADTYTVDYNPEVVGKTLAFDITLKSLVKAKP